MDTRKDYVAPAVAAEDDLEQTSLACNATAGQSVKEANGGNFTAACAVNVQKGNAFIDDDEFCSTYLEWPEEIVVLS